VKELRVAVVGSGPAGIYAAAALTEHDQAAIDVIDRLPTPFGLVRYGVAPDHEKMKSVAVALRRVLEHERVRFLGNIELGGLAIMTLRLEHERLLLSLGCRKEKLYEEFDLPMRRTAAGRHG
jgi:ferredoxin--NADP+ reductase